MSGDHIGCASMHPPLIEIAPGQHLPIQQQIHEFSSPGCQNSNYNTYPVVANNKATAIDASNLENHQIGDNPSPGQTLLLPADAYKRKLEEFKVRKC